MLEKLFGPKYTLKDAMQILEQGLRNGEISVDADATKHAPGGSATQPQRKHGATRMLGGTDIVIPTKGDPQALDACVRMILEYWPQARFENALTGEKYSQYEELPFGRLQELFVYPDAVAEAAWDQGDADAAKNSMLYLILSAGHVTVTLDDPKIEPIQSMLESIRRLLDKEKDIWDTFAEAA